MDRKYIYLLVGRSGSGKSTVADILAEKHGWKVLQSYTTRKPRFPGETGHTFVTKEEFDVLQNKCAYTMFSGNEYCATDDMVDDSDVYIIDPAGVEFFVEAYKGRRTPICVVIDLLEEEAAARMNKRQGASDTETKRRLKNDAEQFKEVRSRMVKLGLDLIMFDGAEATPEQIAAGIYQDSVNRG